jgi:hypothetical protein
LPTRAKPPTARQPKNSSSKNSSNKTIPSYKRQAILKDSADDRTNVSLAEFFSPVVHLQKCTQNVHSVGFGA